MGALMGRQGGDILSLEAHFAGIRLEQAGELCNQCRFAGAVGPDNRMCLALHDIERDIIRRRNAAEAFAQPANAQQHVGGVESATHGDLPSVPESR